MKTVVTYRNTYIVILSYSSNKWIFSLNPSAKMEMGFHNFKGNSIIS